MRDFPIDRAANSIFPLCLENFLFVTELETEEEEKTEMLYHNLAEGINELPNIKARIKQILAKTEEIEHPNRILSEQGK